MGEHVLSFDCLFLASSNARFGLGFLYRDSQNLRPDPVEPDCIGGLHFYIFEDTFSSRAAVNDAAEPHFQDTLK